MFVDLFTKSLPVPTDATATVTIRRLSWAELNEAQLVARDALLQMVGGLKGLRDMQQSAAPAAPAAEASEAADGFAAHDPRTLLKYGITAWTYSRPITAANLALIDEDSAQFFARQIFDFTKGRSEAEQKNG